MKFFRRKSGFSLMEMSVVMAAAAAIVVVTASGVSLVNKTRLGDILTDVNHFSTAIVRFQARYKAMPGDIADVSAISDATAGNGNSSIDSAAESLHFWRHLSLVGFIDGTYDGSSTNVPGTGVPMGSINKSGYNIIDPSTVAGVPDQAIIIEFAGFSASANDLPILKPEDAKSIDEKADDGDPDTGIIRALGSGSGGNCVAGGVYNVSNSTVSCRLRFIIASQAAKSNASALTGGCNEIGLTRESPAVANICPTGFVGNVMETCRINSSNVGSWEVTATNCDPVMCSGNKRYGESRTISCINGMTGTGIAQTCSAAGIWVTDSSDCTTVSNSISGLKLHLDAADSSTIFTKTNCTGAISDGDSVACWQDKSGNGYDATQGTVGRQPIYIGNGINYKPALKFTSNSLSLTGMTNAVSNYTLFVVKNPTTQTTWDYWFDIQTGRMVFGTGGSVTVQYNDGVGWRDTGSSLTYVPQILTYNLASGSGKIYKDGTQIGSTLSYTQNDIGGTILLGGEYAGSASSYYKGNISEFLIYNQAVTTAEQQMLESYLSDKWGIALTSGATSTDSTCPLPKYSLGDIKAPQACDWGEEGRVLQTCAAPGLWATSSDNCAAVACTSPAGVFGDTNTAETCSSVDGDYLGNTMRVCSIDGTWRRTSIGSTCVPQYGTGCTPDDTKDIGCPPGKTGTYTQTCLADGATNYWVTTSDKCIPVTCDGENIGETRIREGHLCPNGQEGTVLEVCDTDGEWDFITNNCVDSVCNGTEDTRGYATWPNQANSTTAAGACISGYTSGTNPTRDCASGTWSLSIMNPCTRAQCAAVTESGAAWPLTDSNTTEVVGTCDWPLVEGYTTKDCDASGNWINLLSSCKPVGLPKTDSSLTLWLDADDPSTVHNVSTCDNYAKNGQTIGCWKDKSGNGNNVTQSNATYQPAYNVGTLNGKPVIEFTSDYMVTPSISTRTIFITSRLTYSSPTYVLDFRDGIGSSYLYSATPGSWYGGYFWKNGVYNSIASSQYMNGIWQVNTLQTTSTASGVMHLMSKYTNNEYGVGSVAEVIVYNTTLAESERIAIEKYLADKWGLSALPVATDNVLWLDAADADTLFQASNCTTAITSGATVGCWKDKSGNANNATGTAEPTYNTNALNEKSVLNFNGTTNVLALPNGVIADGDIPYTVSVVVESETLSIDRGFLNLGSYSTDSALAFSFDNPTFQILHYWWGDDIYSTANSVSNNQPYVLTFLYDTSVGRDIYINGALNASDASITRSGLNNGSGTVGKTYSGQYWDGDIAEILVYDRMLSLEEQKATEKYLGDKWDISVTPVGDSSLRLWLDAADASTVHEVSACTDTAEDNDEVMCWQDKSGNGYNMTQTTVSRKPRYNTNTLNSRAVISFDGTGGTEDYLINANYNHTSDDFSILTVVKRDTVASVDQKIIAYHYSGTASVFQLRQGVTTGGSGVDLLLQTYNAGWETKYTSSPDVFGNTNYKVIAAIKSGTNTEFYIDGATYSSTGTSDATLAASTSNDLFIGIRNLSTANGWDGDIAELLLYDIALTTTERTDIENYLSVKWDIDLSPVASGDASLKLWLDASDESTLFTDSACSTSALSGDNVGCWQDKSGSGLHVTQAGADTLKPTYKESGRNDKGVVSFDGNDQLSKTSVLGSSLASAEEATVMAVQKYNTPAHNSSTIYWHTTSAGGNRINLHAIATTSLIFDLGVCCGGATRTSVTPSGFTNVWNLVTASRTTADIDTIWVNGDPLVSAGNKTSPFSTVSTATLAIGHVPGSTYDLDGEIGEILLYNRGIPNDEREDIEAALGDKWGIDVWSLEEVNDLVLWLDAADSSTVHTTDTTCSNPAANGQEVYCWQDKSGNGNNATQATTRPVYNTSGINSRGTIDFNGTDDVLLADHHTSLAIEGDMSVFFVGKRPDYTVAHAILSKTKSNNFAGPYDFYNSGGRYSFFRGYGDWYGSSYSQIDATTSAESIAIIMRGTIVDFYRDGLADGLDNTLSITMTDRGDELYIGGRADGGTRYKGNYAEVLLYNRAVTTTERQDIENYLMVKWGI